MYSTAIAVDLRTRGVDAISVHERHELEGRPDREVLRAATGDRRVLVSNNARHFAPIVSEFGLKGEAHFGVILTDDATFPRSREGLGLLVRSLAAFAARRADDEMLDDCQFLPRID
jgi:hypothetical protein